MNAPSRPPSPASPVARRLPGGALRRLGTAGLGLLLAVGCRPPAGDTYQGYLEAEFVYVASPVPGTLLERPVERGQVVHPGDLLFVLESGAESAAVAEADRRAAAAAARVENLLKGRRPTELAALEAQVERQRAAADLWRAEFSRHQDLFAQKVLSAAELDQARSQYDAARAALEAAEAEQATARLGGRDDEIRAAREDQEAALAALDRARWALDQKRQVAPVGGLVHDTLFRPGEFVPAGQPVLALLPPANLRARFFVPEPLLGRLRLGDPVQISRDGADTPVEGRLQYISGRAEFTPPVIYSRETRAKLVFMVEASLPPAIAATLRPGQPVDVRLLPGPP